MAAESRFPEWYRQTAAALGWRRVDNLDVALAAWSDFIDECTRGYTFGLEEYTNDLSVRDALQLVFAEEADRLAGAEDVRRRVRELDGRFRALLQPGVVAEPGESRWWRAGVLRRGGPTLASDLEEEYGIAMERQQ